jgi:TP901 family phage tail tape measure protein
MASRKEYEMLFRLGAELSGSYNSTFKSATGSVAAMQKEIQAMSKVQSDISAYQKQNAAIESTKNKLDVLKQQYDNLQREMVETGDSSAALQNKLLSKQLQIDKTNASLSTQAEKLNRLDSALKEAGVNTGDLAKENAELANKIEAVKQKQEDAAEASGIFGKQSVAAMGAVHEAIIAAGILKALDEIKDAFYDTADASIEFESAMTGVDKTTELSSEEFAQMSKEIKELSTVIPETTTEIALIGETAGQLGIAKDGLMEFTDVMAMMGTATNMASDEAATLFAQMASITQMDQSEYSNMGSTVVDLGNNFSTTERNIAEMSQTIAAAGSISGMSEASILAISAAVTSLGITSQNGGTQMTKLISDINSAVSSGEDLADWADVANMSADEFAEAWGNDAAQGLDAFIVGLNRAYESGEDIYSILGDLGITETRMLTMITSLAKSGDRLTETLDVANEAWIENNALTEEAEKRYATTASLMQLKENAYNNLKIAIGDNYTPALRELYGLEADLANELAEFVENNPEVVKAVTAFTAVIGTATAGVVAYTAAVNIAKKASALMIAGTASFMGAAVAVAAVTAAAVAMAETTKVQLDETWELTAASREQQEQLESLNEEYQSATDLYGENSYEAMRLRWEIEDLTDEYENSKQTLEEYQEAHKSLMESYDEMTASHQDGSEKINTEQKNVMMLIGKLEELTSTTQSASENQQAILGIIDALNESVPELAISYDDVVNASEGFIDSLYDVAKAQSDQMTLEQKWSEYIDRIGEQDALKSAKEAAEQNAKIAQEQYDIANKAYMDALEADSYDSSASMREKITVAAEAGDQLRIYNEALEETTEAYRENESAISELESAFKEYQAQVDEAAENGGNLKEAIKSVTDEVNLLATSYTEAYDAAESSITGQYQLWDDAADIVATSASSINANLESQIGYWQSYNENIAALGNRSADIQGLSDMIASFADGSEDSVNAIAGMANASDDDLKKMVENWHDLQLQQETTAGSLANLETEFSLSMQALQEKLETTIDEMDLNDEAIDSGRNTVQGFIDGAQDMLPAVQEAYEEIANAAIGAFDRKLEIHSPSRVMWDRAEMTWDGFILSTEQMRPEIESAMSNQADAGINAFAITPNFTNAQNGIQADSGIEALSFGASQGDIEIKIDYSPQYDFTGVSNKDEFEAILKSRDAEFKNMILDVIADAKIDAKRRAYD